MLNFTKFLTISYNIKQALNASDRELINIDCINRFKAKHLTLLTYFVYCMLVNRQYPIIPLNDIKQKHAQKQLVQYLCK